MTSEMPKETKKSTMPMMLGAVVVVAGVAAGGLFMMSEKDKAPSAATAEAVQAQTPAAGEEKKAEAAPETPQVIGEGENAVEVGNPVVARVGGQDIMRSEVLEFITTLPEQARQMPLQNLFPMARDRVVGEKMIAAKAVSANLDADPEVQKTLDQVKEQIIRNVYVDRAIKEAVKEEDLQKAYEELKVELAKVEETKARHILVDSEEKAREVITKLDAGEKFEALSAEYSMDQGNKDNGGDLGYFAKTDMVPEFAEAAFALAVGQYTKDAVKTQFGFHVIKAEDRRQRQAPEYEVVKPQLETVVRQRKLAELVDAWQKEANVEVFDINGKAEAAPAAPSENKTE